MGQPGPISATLVLSATALVLPWDACAPAEQSTAVKCIAVQGMIDGPIVATAQAAREIYTTIAHDRGDKIPRENKIVAMDEGDHWSVFQYPAQLPPPAVGADGSMRLAVAMGGGRLEMKISKCNGSISASYSR